MQALFAVPTCGRKMTKAVELKIMTRNAEPD
jgi:hypothetical protein